MENSKELSVINVEKGGRYKEKEESCVRDTLFHLLLSLLDFYKSTQNLIFSQRIFHPCWALVYF
jgi:hypothetical protein